MVVDDQQFQSLLDQIRELHRVADELTRSPRLHAHIRARLSWSRDVPSLPPEQLEVADEVVAALETRQLSAQQSRQLQGVFFGR